MNMKIKAGLIGCDLSLRAGMIFRNRTPGQFEFVAICDRDPEMLRRFHEQLPAEKCRDYSDYRDLLRDPEVNTVFIMVRDQYHEEMPSPPSTREKPSSLKNRWQSPSKAATTSSAPHTNPVQSSFSDTTCATRHPYGK